MTAIPLRSVPDLPSTLTDMVSTEVIGELISGALAPGDRVSPERLARRFGVSHIPVREALRTLAAEGHLTQEPRRGFFVPELTAEEVVEVYSLRTLLEEEALSEAAPLLSADDFTTMRRLIREMESARRSGDPLAYHLANRDFHFVPFNKLNRPVLHRFLDYLWVAVPRYYVGLLGAEVKTAKLQRDHRQLVQLLERGEVEAANQLMREHRQMTVNAITGRLENREV